ncbi:MAG: ABC transporter permease [Bacillota bacterium]
MRNIYRGFRSLRRNLARTTVILLILGLVACLSLAMLAVERGVSSRVAEVEATVGTLIDVRPAGAIGPGPDGELLPLELVDDLALLDGVADVVPLLVARTADPSRPGSGEPMQGGPRFGSFTLGVEPDRPLSVPGGGRVEIVSGRSLEPGDAGRAVVVVGALLASERGLAVGSTVEFAGRDFEVVGIHESESRMGRSAVFMPLDTAVEVLGLGGLTQVTVRVTSIGEVDAVREAILAAWGETVDVVAQKDSFAGRFEETLGNLRATSRIGLLLSLIAAGAVVFGTMFLVVRERSREIGILKAIGAGRRDIALQFGAEAVALSLIGALIGVILLGLIGPSVASAVVSLAGQSAPAVGPGGMPGAQMFMARQGVGVLLGSLDITVTWALAACAAAGGVALGLIGGLVPALAAANLKPAEVIRGE